MSKITIETTITPRYLRGKTKDEIIDHVMRLLDENDALAKQLETTRKERDQAIALTQMRLDPNTKTIHWSCKFSGTYDFEVPELRDFLRQCSEQKKQS